MCVCLFQSQDKQLQMAFQRQIQQQEHKIQAAKAIESQRHKQRLMSPQERQDSQRYEQGFQTEQQIRDLNLVELVFQIIDELFIIGRSFQIKKQQIRWVRVYENGILFWWTCCLAQRHHWVLGQLLSAF